MTDRNLGKFRITASMVRECPEKVAEVFAMLGMVVVRCEQLYAGDELEYIAISRRFAEVERGRMIPEYSLEITQSKAGNIELVEVKPIN